MLELKKISAGYEKKLVLEEVTAAFSKGKLTGIVGVNGSGKSTLLKVALGLLPPSSGSVLVDGQDLRGLRRNEIAKKITYLAQGKNTPAMTVEQLVLHGRFPYLSYPRHYTHRDKEAVWSVMESVGIAELAQMPLDTLSGGMRQNAYIAMALAQDTDYILLDEPTTYLDLSHQLELMKLLRKIADAGKGIVCVMHDLPLAFDFSDEILVLKEGQIAAQKRPSELCTGSVISELFRVQIKRIGNSGKYYYDIADI